MKYIIIVPDGMADYPIESFGDKTPLEAAHTVNMDHIAQRGFTGLVKTIPEGLKPGSDIGNLALMGYDPTKDFTGRAPLEAANLGISLEDDEVAFRCNLVTIEKDTMVDYSAGHIPTEEATTLITALDKEIDIPGVRFYPGKSYRHLVVVKSQRLKDLTAVKCTPPHDIIGQKISAFLPQGQQNIIPLRIMEKAAGILKEHTVNQVRLDLKENPANAIWLWGQGVRPNLPRFFEKFGLDGAIISAVDLVNGIGRLAGLEVINVPGITGYYDTNYRGKADYAIQALKKKDFVFIHIEAPDEAGHNGDAKMKMQCIERIDREIVGTILNHFGDHADVRILIAPDHATPVSKRTHTSEPVGFVMYGKGISPDGSSEYSESSTRAKGVKFQSGEEMVTYFIRKNAA